ncbi:MAG TPA: hypothetical protein VNI54_05960 [Thermoanaerobaculia bacterium]|nr:hypothetical protein [Thermoanaerobaculia bacterium]
MTGTKGGREAALRVSRCWLLVRAAFAARFRLEQRVRGRAENQQPATEKLAARLQKSERNTLRTEFTILQRRSQ